MTIHQNLNFTENYGTFIHDSLFKEALDTIEMQDNSHHAESSAKITALRDEHVSDVNLLTDKVNQIQTSVNSLNESKIDKSYTYSKEETDNKLANKLDTFAYAQDKTIQDGKNSEYDNYGARLSTLENSVASLESSLSGLISRVTALEEKGTQVTPEPTQGSES